MNITHRLKQEILKYLSENNFEKCEFKHIHKGFIQCFPEFQSKKYYPKIYIIIRNLAESNFIFIDRTGCTFKYSTNRNQRNILDHLDIIYDKDSLKKKLLFDYHQTNSKLHKIKVELETFDKYLVLYPNIKSKISTFTSERSNNLLKLESELSAIDIILNNI